MEDFIGNASSPQLLILMSFPLIGSVLLSIYLIVFVRRNRKKEKMKHGIQSTKAPTDSTPDNVLSVDSADDVSPGGAPSSTPSIETPPASPAEVGLNLDVLSSQVETEAFSMDTPEQPNEEKVDLAARLGIQPPMTTPASELAELLRLLRHPQTGELVVEIAGQRYAKLSDVADKEVGQYILELIAHLLVFSNGKITTPAGVKSVYLPKRLGETPPPIAKPTPISELPDPTASTPSPAPSEPEPTPSEPGPVPPPSPEAEAAFRASLQAQPPQSSEPQPQSKGFFGRSTSTSGAKAPPGFNLAKEINQIVQTRLMVSPLSTTTKVDIAAAPGGGIQINVDNVSYSSPDDIPDLEVRALIKESIKQWERS